MTFRSRFALLRINSTSGSSTTPVSLPCGEEDASSSLSSLETSPRLSRRPPISRTCSSTTCECQRTTLFSRAFDELELTSLFSFSFSDSISFKAAIAKAQPGWRRVVAQATISGTPVSRISLSLFVDSTSKLTASRFFLSFSSDSLHQRRSLLLRWIQVRDRPR